MIVADMTLTCRFLDELPSSFRVAETPGSPVSNSQMTYIVWSSLCGSGHLVYETEIVEYRRKL